MQRHAEFEKVGDLVKFLSSMDPDRGLSDKYGEPLLVLFNLNDSGEDVIFSPNLEAVEL